MKNAKFIVLDMRSLRVDIMFDAKGQVKWSVMNSKYIFSWAHRFSWIFFLSILLFIHGDNCMVPQASQEGSLHSFKSYSDVAIFHYTVPKEVLRATWQFAAFMDGKNCLPRKVHIYIQWGSYPIISVNNASFPPHMYTKRNGTILVSVMTTFEPKTTATVPIYGPEAGDWFVGAYMSHWDEKVQQQGLGHKCHYSIGSVAIWMQTNGIQNIPIGYQKTLHTTEPTSYYKIYIPSGTWHFQVHVWACNFTLHTQKDMNKPCIQGLALKGRVLPVFNHTHPSPIGNLTILDSYTFTEFSPYEDSYYYLLVISDSVIDFNVKVIISECPIKDLGKSLMRQYLDAPSFSKALVKLRMRNDSLQHDNYRLYKNQFELSSEDVMVEDPCVPRFQLARVKHSQTFSGVYLLQVREWLTSWAMLTDSYPIMTQFNILPLIDIGGTLDIRVHLEMDKLLTKQLILVTICIQRSRVPNRINGQIICDDENMSMTLSSYNKQDGNVLIPYPQPDTWYIGFQAKCYMNGNPVTCEMEGILVSLDVRTRQCVFSGSHACGHHGVCQEIQKGLLYYTTCNCFGGYKGWGCTDATNASPMASVLLTTLMLTLSNGFFLPAIYLAIRRGLYTEGLVYFATMLFSSLYHACDQQFMTYCVAKYEVLQYSDFFSGILAVWVTLVAMAGLPTQYISLCHMFGVLIIAFGVESDRTGLPSILVPLAMGTIIPMAAYVYRCVKNNKWKWPDNIVKLLFGLSLATVGLLLFSLVETEANYHYVHSAWHIVIALSLLFVLPPARVESFLPLANTSLSGSDIESRYK
ncbi:post-GPI attachment to proteins factor 6 isoform X3 [Cephus cinctus]|uniref:Post-GPI attachment to proteins factor 6 isoform X3 n=1 Tax=Cephus cinctus TaxID=211228 RepID=A0AAJ7CFF9_CEPCN|nr:post-GPI attachment to proteins factor 6 isoform X3 [Cephus cinctus]XP_024947667.1 post-GPI attachment to proteins factor 6 isoform X3 [Cephus cinctus]